MRNLAKRFYCELFDTHDWEFILIMKERYQRRIYKYKCKKCGKEKWEDEPVMMTSIWESK